MLRFSLLVLISLLLTSASSAEQSRDDVRVYIFGNSLVHHLTKSDETTIPHWLHHFAISGNKRFAINGQWGFLRNFANDLPPNANWSFKEAKSAWSGSFSRSQFNNVIITPANFIQYQSADTLYEGDNPTKQSPLSATLKLIDWLQIKQKGLTYYIFEGWTDMAQFSSSFPPSPRAYKRFFDHNMGKTRAWFVEFVNMIKAKRPDVSVKLLPIGSTLSKMLTQTDLKSLKPEVMFSDNAPHGTANTYFLGAVIAYAALYGRPPASDFKIPSNIEPIITQNFAKLADLACKEVAKFSTCKPTQD